MQILSWNVNGLRACAKKGFGQWLAGTAASVVGLQEVRAKEDQLDASVRQPDGWHTYFFPAERPGYSGVALYSRQPFDEIHTSLGVEAFDQEGRFQCARLGSLWIVNVYFPNGSGKDRDNSRIPFKLDFYRAVAAQLAEKTRRCERILVMGDFNTAHEPIDLARPKANKKTSGFCPEERAELSRWLQEEGWHDSFREQHPDAGEHYTWWSNRPGVRARNVGWRIDYILANPHALPFCQRSFLLPEVMGSDHCPVGVEMSPDVVSLA